MPGSIPLLRVRGIRIRIHFTFVLLLAWVAHAWGAGGDADARDARFGMVAILLTFGCIALHELGHAAVARRYGIEVRDIVLWAFGGMTLVKVPRNPKQELWITLAGPAVNIAIVAILVAVIAALRAIDPAMANDPGAAWRDRQWSGLPFSLALANLGLVVFNAIPAFPLDGGRVLRALLGLCMPYRWATRIAGTIGQGLALALAIVAVLYRDYFLIAIALFIWLGASAELRRVLAGESPDATARRRLMTQPPPMLTAPFSTPRPYPAASTHYWSSGAISHSAPGSGSPQTRRNPGSN